MVFYIVAAVAAGPEYVSKLSDGMSPILFAIMSSLKFAVGVTIVYNGVRMILGDLIPAFQGIATKLYQMLYQQLIVPYFSLMHLQQL